MNNADCIKLSFPLNPSYVSLARLTVSSIANRTKFDIDDIEDIKTAVSEACNYILGQLPKTKEGSFDLTIVPTEEKLTIEIIAGLSGEIKEVDSDENPVPSAVAAVADEEMSLMVIRALVDKFTITKQGKIFIALVKEINK